MNAVDRSRLPGLGPDPSFTFPDIHKQALSNGLQIWTVERRDLPMVSFTILIPVGSAADPSDRPGLAAVAADLLDEGSAGRSAIEVHEALARLGAQFDLEIGADATAVSLTVLSRYQAEGLGIVADMLMRPSFREADFSRVRELRLHRLLQLRDVPGAVADRVFTEKLYRGHPYGHLAIGTDASLREMKLEELVEFHRRHHVPTGATLIAVGDATHAELRKVAVDAFGPWTGGLSPSGAAPGLALGSHDDGSNEKLVLVHRPGAAQSELRLGHVAVARNTPDYHALLVLNMVLGGQFVSRINLNLREDKGYTYGVRTSFEFRRGRGPFIVQTSVQTDATARAVAEVIGELRAIRGERPISAQELAHAQAALTRGYPRGFETVEQIARAATQLALYGLPDDYFSQFAPRVAEVDERAVTRVANEHLDPDRLLTVMVGDRDKIGPSLDALDMGGAVEAAAV